MQTQDGSPGVQPSLEEFRAYAADQRVITVATRLVADAETPVSLYQQLAENRPGTFLLESVEHGVTSRYSFIGVRSAATLTEVDREATWLGHAPVGLPTGGDPLEVLAESLRLLQITHTPHDLPPFTSGLVGYLAYDVVRRIEKLPDTCVDDLQVPELAMMLVTDMAVFDHDSGEVWLLANAINFDDSPGRVDRAYADAVDRIEQMTERLTRPRAPMAQRITGDRAPDVVRQRTSDEHEEAVREAVEEIRAGEAFQIVVSQRFEVATSADALTIYRRLRRINPSPYLYLLRLDGFDIVGSSPEALVTVTGHRATTRPIAGTRPRGSDTAHDMALEAELLADEKERAEHLMLVDLGRNDLGRVCRPGTVSVVEFMQVRRYSHVMHLESTVEGDLAEDRTALAATLSCLPAGTLSGAPKVRAMEIIDRLEVTRRGTYGGVVGWFNFTGDSDCAITIRTALIKDGTAYVQAGGGIVADSVPHAEDLETQNKAGAVIGAILAAEGLAEL